jgi:hypothetical protein
MEKRKAKGILVPILEQILERPLEIEDDEDIAFMLKLMQERARPREKGVFSPSMLSSCMRKSYFCQDRPGKEVGQVATYQRLLHRWKFPASEVAVRSLEGASSWSARAARGRGTCLPPIR